MAVNQFQIGQRNRQQSVVRDKAEKIKKPSLIASAMGAVTGANRGPSGPATLAAGRDAWANALQSMSGVNTPDPITAVAKVAGMGLAGYQQGKATRGIEEGTTAFRQKLADALKGGADGASVAGLMADPYAAGSEAQLMKLWERANPTEDDLQQRKLRDMQMQRSQQEFDFAKLQQEQQGQQFKNEQTTFQQQQDEITRQKALRGGRMDAVEGFNQNIEAQGGNLFSPEIQQQLRGAGIEGVDPAEARRYRDMQPNVQAGMYDEAYQQMVAPPSKDNLMAVDGQLYNSLTGQWVTPPGGSGKPTDDMREWKQSNADKVARGEEPEALDDYLVRMKKAGASSVSVDTKGQNKYAEERGKGFADFANKSDIAEQSAMAALNSIDVMKQAMADPNFYSGSGAEQVMALRRAVVAMGGDPDQVSSMETFQGQAKKLALDSMGGSLGSGFSNADRDFITGQVPYLENTPEGNKALMEIMSRLNRRKIELARMGRQYEVDKGQIDAGFFQQMSQWSEENKLFPEVTQGGAVGGAPAPRKKPAEMSDDELKRALGGG